MAVQLTHQRLSNGLQSLSDASPDYELAPVGIASMHDQAQKLAEAGRNGDIYVIHAAEGETVIPMEVLAANPQIKQLLFAQMKDMGLDPQEFVVGNDLNSINPVTGMPEFFFKSIFRSVKKAVKKVFKFAKKIAPIAIPIALSAFGLPAGLPFGLSEMFGAGMASTAALGGGLGSLVGGGSLKDVFKSALISGGIATLGAGLTQGIRGTEGTFGEEFMKGASQTWGGEAVNPISTGVSDVKETLLDTMGLGDKSIENTYLSPSTGVVHDQVVPSDAWGLNKRLVSTAVERGLTVEQQQMAAQAVKDTLAAQKGSGVMEFISPTSVKAADVLAHHTSQPELLKQLKALHPSVLQTALKDLNPGTIAKYAPMALAGAGAAYGGGMFDPPVEEEVTEEDLQFGTELSGPNPLFAADPDKFKIPVNPFQFTPSTDPFVPPAQFAADGGMINGPGTGTSDSIPGWLSDGEFVLTERAVRGADPTGQGRRKAGANNLYNIMRNFEMSA